MKIDRSIILSINAQIKYMEYILHIFDTEDGSKTLFEIRNDFRNIFHTSHPLLNQYFGIYRLIPLIMIKEDYKNTKNEMNETNKIIKTIRDAIAHGNFEMTENGYSFYNDKEEKCFTYDEFNKFLYQIENEYYR